MFLMKVIQKIRFALVIENEIFYINGSETLPPPLTREEEQHIMENIAKGDSKAREPLIVHNLRLVVYIAKKFETPNASAEDLISIGTIGLIKAVNTFSPEKNIKLATYASRCIENEILMFLRKSSQLKNEVSIDEPLNTDWDGNDLDNAPTFYKGAAVTPVYDPLPLQINKLRQKVDAGAQYIQTQGIFDIEGLKRFMDEVDKANIHTHIMAGIIPLKAAGMAKYMNENVPGIAVPQDMIDRLSAAAAEGKEKGVKGLPTQLGIEMAAEMIAKIKDEGICDGVHIMAIGAEKNVPKILEKAGITIE